MRDGLQAEQQFIETEQKISLVDALSETGVSKIEVTAFVSPKAIPALRDSEQVLREIRRTPGVVYSALVPNIRGAERAIESRADELNLVMSASESHNLSNLRMTRDQSFTALSDVAALAASARVRVNVSFSCAFGCPMEGDVELDNVLTWCERYLNELGTSAISLCDTTGMAYPSQVFQTVQAFRQRWPEAELTLHFHNTRGLGMANVLAAIAAGADRFDASLAGLGGCPYAPGASGNVCTEEVVHGLNLMGFATGVDLARLMDCATTLSSWFEHEVPSQLLKAGGRLQLHPLPPDFAQTRERALARD